MLNPYWQVAVEIGMSHGDCPCPFQKWSTEAYLWEAGRQRSETVSYQEMVMTLSEFVAYREGAAAGYDGDGSECPYPEGTLEHAAWISGEHQGWMDS